MIHDAIQTSNNINNEEQGFNHVKHQAADAFDGAGVNAVPLTGRLLVVLFAVFGFVL